MIFFGIAAIVGAGVFSKTIGQASFDGGPAVIFLFMFTALACGFAAMAYAEFASMVPVSGSAYTYSYVAFGEMIAWIIGWSLIMEYAVGNITLAISWSDYFTGLLDNMGIHFNGYKWIICLLPKAIKMLWRWIDAEKLIIASIISNRHIGHGLQLQK